MASRLRKPAPVTMPARTAPAKTTAASKPAPAAKAAAATLAEARAEIERLTGEVAKAQRGDGFKRKFETLTAEHETLRAENATLARKFVLVGAGITDPDDQEYILVKHERTKPAEGETKPAFDDWFAAQQTAKPAWLERMKSPATTTPAATTTTPAATTAATETTPAAPAATTTATAPAKVTATTRTSPDAAIAAPAPGAPPTGAPTAAQIAAMSTDEYRSWRKKNAADVGKGFLA